MFSFQNCHDSKDVLVKQYMYIFPVQNLPEVILQYTMTFLHLNEP